MSHLFPDIPVYQGFYAPSRVEADIFDLEVAGEIPAAIDGTFYRCGPDPQFPPLLGTDVRFNGDGMVSMFRFKNGRVDFKSRYAQTDKFKLERSARKALFGAYRNPFTDDPSVIGRIRGTANTNVIFHGGRLYALKEDSPALAMDPHTLATEGYAYFNQAFTSQTFTAHPKIDPRTGEMLAFGYAAKGVSTRDIAYYVIDKFGRITHEVWLKAPYASMVHDWVVTDDYVVFPIFPLTSDIERTKAGKPAFMWDDTQQVQVGILPRYGKASDIRWFCGPARFTGHFLNGYNDGTKVVIDGPFAKTNIFPFFADVHGKPFDEKNAFARLTRWIVDLSRSDEGYTEIQLADAPGEFPKIDERFCGRPYEHGFMLLQDPSKPFINGRIAINTIAHIELKTGRTRRFYTGDNCGVQEPVFVPRSPDAPEADGYLLAVRNHTASLSSDLIILDVQRIEDGPIATVRLPLRLRDAIHGNWVPSSALFADSA